MFGTARRLWRTHAMLLLTNLIIILQSDVKKREKCRDVSVTFAMKNHPAVQNGCCRRNHGGIKVHGYPLLPMQQAMLFIDSAGVLFLNVKPRFLTKVCYLCRAQGLAPLAKCDYRKLIE